MRKSMRLRFLEEGDGKHPEAGDDRQRNQVDAGLGLRWNPASLGRGPDGDQCAETVLLARKARQPSFTCVSAHSPAERIRGGAPAALADLDVCIACGIVTASRP